MELINTGQIHYEDLLYEDIDLLLISVSKNYNTEQLSNVLLIPARRKILLIEDENERIPSFELYELFEKIVVENNKTEQLLSILENLCRQSQCETVKIVIDYTDMSKRLLSTFIQFISLHEPSCKRMTIYFYCHAGGSGVKNMRFISNNKMEPLLSYESFRFENRPISLIISIDDMLNANDFHQIIEFFSPVSVYLYFQQNKIAYLKKFYNFKNTKTTYVETIYEYDEHNIEQTDNQLRNLVRQLRVRNRVIIFPLSGKTFTLVTFLLNSRYPDVEIWSLGENNNCSLFSEHSSCVYKAEMIKDDIDGDDELY